MAEFWSDLNLKIKSLASGWPSYTALGSFALYVLGYLSLRFHLTALGVSTDLNVIDERYLFTGAKFLVYVVSTIPILLLLLSPFALLAFLMHALLPGRLNVTGALLKKPNLLCALGVLISVFLIQFVMRQCFFYSNLLMARELPGPGWLRSIILQEDDGLRSLYFTGLIAGCALTGTLLWLALRSKADHPAFPFWKGLLAALLAIEILFLPVNYGTLIMDKTLPRISDPGGQPPSDDQTVWLVWEGGEGLTYLVRKMEAGKEHRSLITLPRKDVKRIEINGFDPILRVLFGNGQVWIP